MVKCMSHQSQVSLNVSVLGMIGENQAQIISKVDVASVSLLRVCCLPRNRAIPNRGLRNLGITLIKFLI